MGLARRPLSLFRSLARGQNAKHLRRRKRDVESRSEGRKKKKEKRRGRDHQPPIRMTVETTAGSTQTPGNREWILFGNFWSQNHEKKIDSFLLRIDYDDS